LERLQNKALDGSGAGAFGGLTSTTRVAPVKLDYHILKDAVNWFFGRYVDPKTRPTFFNIPMDFPELSALTDNYQVIRDEFEAVSAHINSLPQYHEVDSGERAISNTTPKRWNVFMLEIMGYKPAANRAMCPKTSALLERVPNLMQAFFSILDPGKSIPEHEGPYLGYLRYHLGLRVPTNNPPKLVVNGQDYVWKEGEGVLFDDSWPHKVVNNSSEMRTVLIVDIRRPLPWLPNLVNGMLINGLARPTYGRSVARKADAFAKSYSGAAGAGAAN
jgi:aspartyl/asparaginyl beta-hydroxylase (cupin superfamily)